MYGAFSMDDFMMNKERNEKIMYKINVHLAEKDGKVVLPDSFRYCTGETPNEFFAWREDGDVIVETTINDGKLLQQKIEEWEKNNPENPVVYSVYYDDCEGESFVKTFWNKEDAIAFMINDAMAVLAIFKESGDEVKYTVKNEMVMIEDPKDQEFYYSWLIYENEIQ